jgi:hypothetical protein
VVLPLPPTIYDIYKMKR